MGVAVLILIVVDDGLVLVMTLRQFMHVVS